MWGKAMAEQGGTPTLTSAGRRTAEGRQKRLAAALRENLRKRKAQQRSRAADPAPSLKDPETKVGGHD
jgi:hypothetical protein